MPKWVFIKSADLCEPCRRKVRPRERMGPKGIGEEARRRICEVWLRDRNRRPRLDIVADLMEEIGCCQKTIYNVLEKI